MWKDLRRVGAILSMTGACTAITSIHMTIPLNARASRTRARSTRPPRPSVIRCCYRFKSTDIWSLALLACFEYIPCRCSITVVGLLIFMASFFKRHSNGNIVYPVGALQAGMGKKRRAEESNAEESGSEEAFSVGKSHVLPQPPVFITSTVAHVQRSSRLPESNTVIG